MKSLLLLLTISCSTAFENATARIYDASGIHGGGIIDIRYVDSSTVPCIGRNDTVGCTKGRTVTIAGRSEYKDEVLMHEYFHALGSGHSDYGIMTKQHNMGGYRPCISAQDLKALCSVASCKWQKPECK